MEDGPANPGAPSPAAPPSTKAALPKRTSGRRPAPHPYAVLRQAAAAGQRSQLASVPPFAIHGADPEWMKTEELDRLWHARLEEERHAEAQQWRDSPQLPPFEKAALNWFATAPARAVLGLLAMSGPGRRAEAEEQMRKLRPLQCTPAEEAACDAVEQLLDMTGTMLAPSAAEATVARQAALALARQGAREAGHAAELIAAEQVLGLFEEGAAEAAQSGPRFTGLLDRLPPRLNPLNYRVCGVSCGGGEIEFKPPKLPIAVQPADVSPTRFIAGARIESYGNAVQEGPVDLGPTLKRIESGGSYPHPNDGTFFKNREGLLPSKPEEYYREYVVPTPGTQGAGPQRVIRGQQGELYYTPDHYRSFIPLNKVN